MIEQPYREFSSRLFSRSVQAPQPIKAQFEITYRCNIRCVHCYTDPFNTPSALGRELAFPDIVRLLDELAGAGVLWMTLTGGEAFAHPRFKEIYRAAKDRGFILALFTNGTTVTDSLADFLAEDPPFKIEMSLHAATAATYEAVTQVPGSHARCLEGIRRLLDRKLPLSLKTNGMALNRLEIPRIKAFVESLGLAFRLDNILYPRLNGDMAPTLQRLSPAELLVLEGDDSCVRNWEPEDSEAPPDDRLFRCGCGTNAVTISPYGVLRPCSFTTWPQYDLRRTPFKEAFQKLAETIQEARYAGPSACRACPAHVFCDKNPAMAAHEAGSREAPVDYFCQVAFGRQALAGRSPDARRAEVRP